MKVALSLIVQLFLSSALTLYFFITVRVCVCNLIDHSTLPFFFQNLKVKGPKDSKDCTTTVSMEGKCVCRYLPLCVCVFCVLCVCLWACLNVCRSRLAALRLQHCPFCLCMQWRALGGKLVHVWAISHLHTHSCSLSLSLFAWDRRQWAGGQSEERRWGIWRCFWSSDCVVTAHTVMTVIMNRRRLIKATRCVAVFVFFLSCFCEPGCQRSWFYGRLVACVLWSWDSYQ